MDWMSARYGQLWRQRADDLPGWRWSLEYYQQYCASAVLLLLVPSGLLVAWYGNSAPPFSPIDFKVVLVLYMNFQMLNLIFSFSKNEIFLCGRHVSGSDTVARATGMVRSCGVCLKASEFQLHTSVHACNYAKQQRRSEMHAAARDHGPF
jgi:hypothetical protein